MPDVAAVPRAPQHNGGTRPGRTSTPLPTSASVLRRPAQRTALIDRILTAPMERYNPQNIPPLQTYLHTQCSSHFHDFEANLTLIKLYLLNPHRLSLRCIRRILLKALFQREFGLVKYVLKGPVVEEDKVVQYVGDMHKSLERCEFGEFWEVVSEMMEDEDGLGDDEDVGKEEDEEEDGGDGEEEAGRRDESPRDVLLSVPGFRLAMQRAILELLQQSHRSIPADFLAQSLDLTPSDVPSFLACEISVPVLPYDVHDPDAMVRISDDTDEGARAARSHVGAEGDLLFERMVKLCA